MSFDLAESTVLVHRIGLLLFAAFQVVATIVLVNMLIAMMSHSFEAVQVLIPIFTLI